MTWTLGSGFCLPGSFKIRNNGFPKRIAVVTIILIVIHALCAVQGRRSERWLQSLVTLDAVADFNCSSLKLSCALLAWVRAAGPPHACHVQYPLCFCSPHIVSLTLLPCLRARSSRSIPSLLLCVAKGASRERTSLQPTSYISLLPRRKGEERMFPEELPLDSSVHRLGWSQDSHLSHLCGHMAKKVN